MSPIVVEGKSLTKKYGDQAVVSDVSLQIHQGECFGLLGPNGAGKTSILRMISCLSEMTSGELFVLGQNARKNQRKIKSLIGVIPQEDHFEEEATVLENLMLFARYYKMDREAARLASQDVMRLFRLEPSTHKEVRYLSGGNRRKLSFARGMLHNPLLFIFDEPTVGMDSLARLWIWDYLKKIKREEKSIVLTTHFMEEAETLCDRVAIIDKGKILIQGAPQELIQNEIGKEVVQFEVKNSDISYYTSRIKEKGYVSLTLGNTIFIHVKKEMDSRPVLDFISSSQMVIRRAQLNDVFLKVTGHELKDEPIPYA